MDTKLPKENRPEYGPERPGDDAGEGEYARYARELWDEQEEAMTALHQVWIQNLLFLTNRQWHRIQKDGTIMPDAAPSWRQRPQSNISLAYFKTFLAKATKVRPAWQVIPASSDPEDVKGSELADDVLEAKWRELKLGAVLRKAVAWTIATGTGFILPFWNENSGRIKALEIPMEMPKYDDKGEEIGTEVQYVPCDENGEPFYKDGDVDLEHEPIYVDEGELGVRALSPFQVRVNPSAETDDDVTVFLVAEPLTLREIAARWPEKAHLVKSEDVGSVESAERMLSSLLGGVGDLVTSADDRRDSDMEKALVIHYHERPTPEYPKGRYWAGAGTDVELEEPQDLPDDFWPALIHLSDLEIPGRYYAMSTLESIVGLNREYNEINGAVKEHHNLLLRGKWIADKGSGVTRASITTEPGQVIVKNPGFDLKQADLKPLPVVVYQERERVLNDYEIVSGIHKISMGKAPPGVTSGVAFLQLQEADDTDLGPFLSMLEEAVAALARAALAIIKARYDDERLAYISGPDKKYLVRSFRGTDLAGAVDVVPVAESSFPWSKTAKQSMLLELAGKMPQLFADPDTGMFDTQKFARQLPVGGLESFADGNDLDLNEAMREEEMFRTGEVMQVQPMPEFWQNHEVHYNSHIRVLKSAEFKQWPPEIQEAYKAHVQETDVKRQMARKMGTASEVGQQMVADEQAKADEIAAANASDQAADSGVEGEPPARDLDPGANDLVGAMGMM